MMMMMSTSSEDRSHMSLQATLAQQVKPCAIGRVCGSMIVPVHLRDALCHLFGSSWMVLQHFGDSYSSRTANVNYVLVDSISRHPWFTRFYFLVHTRSIVTWYKLLPSQVVRSRNHFVPWNHMLYLYRN
ncbi:hypothetical protein PILCRDRAFT_474548 [Piloderma croceum F 1598]|uniref:Uncharacterized protein n=1 Tax=Piloderma croceum (strain F 1598) TaxID=765440 RepID=A0A0C3FCE6_PILCF|nr:hypothetical protein PILCRDRAFT_474548 [Piloderma croceum F 1598]